jgi:hypothetical protein
MRRLLACWWIQVLDQDNKEQTLDRRSVTPFQSRHSSCTDRMNNTLRVGDPIEIDERSGGQKIRGTIKHIYMGSLWITSKQVKKDPCAVSGSWAMAMKGLKWRIVWSTGISAHGCGLVLTASGGVAHGLHRDSGVEREQGGLLAGRPQQARRLQRRHQQQGRQYTRSQPSKPCITSTTGKKSFNISASNVCVQDSRDGRYGGNRGGFGGGFGGGGGGRGGGRGGGGRGAQNPLVGKEVKIRGMTEHKGKTGKVKFVNGKPTTLSIKAGHEAEA